MWNHKKVGNNHNKVGNSFSVAMSAYILVLVNPEHSHEGPASRHERQAKVVYYQGWH